MSVPFERERGGFMRRGLKIIAVLLVLAVTLQGGCVFAHDMGTISGIGIDYASWDKEAPPSAVMPTPEPTPTPTPTPEPTPQRPTKFKEVEIGARLHDLWYIRSTGEPEQQYGRLLQRRLIILLSTMGIVFRSTT